MIELDVQLTADHRVVIFHDDRLDRTTDGRGRVSQWDYPRLARLDAGSWFSPAFAGESVLLMSQALQLIRPPCRINLELKRTTQPASLIDRFARCLSWTRSVSRVLASSFEPSLLARLKRANPHVARALLCKRDPFDALAQAVGLSCVALHPHSSLVTPPLVGAVHAAGLRLHVWTVDRLREARRLLEMGVDGIVTNAPDRLAPAFRGFHA